MIVIKSKPSKQTLSAYQDTLKLLNAQYYDALVNIKRNSKSSVEYHEKRALIIEDFKHQKKMISRNLILPVHQKIRNQIQDTWLSIHQAIDKPWAKFKDRFPGFSQFLVFFMLSNGVTALQMFLMPFLKNIFESSDLVNIGFRFGQIGTKVSGDPYYMFDYPAGLISEGGEGGLAYFLAIQISLMVAQIINFFAQRNITFKSKSSPWIAAMWYFLAYIAITLIASALQGFYKAPIYNFFMNVLNWGARGEVTADALTMIIYSAISFWVFFPIFKWIFNDKNVKHKEVL